MPRAFQRKVPDMDPEAVARVLRDRLAAAHADGEPVPGDPMEAAIDRVAGRPEHRQPCQLRDCRPCGYARAILILSQHLAQSREVGSDRDGLLQRGTDLRALAVAAESLDRTLRAFDSTLAAHVSRWATLHTKLEPLRQRGHDHQAMCERPRRALERTRDLQVELEALRSPAVSPSPVSVSIEPPSPALGFDVGPELAL